MTIDPSALGPRGVGRFPGFRLPDSQHPYFAGDFLGDGRTHFFFFGQGQSYVPGAQGEQGGVVNDAPSVWGCRRAVNTTSGVPRGAPALEPLECEFETPAESMLEGAANQLAWMIDPRNPGDDAFARAAGRDVICFHRAIGGSDLFGTGGLPANAWGDGGAAGDIANPASWSAPMQQVHQQVRDLVALLPAGHRAHCLGFFSNHGFADAYDAGGASLSWPDYRQAWRTWLELHRREIMRITGQARSFPGLMDHFGFEGDANGFSWLYGIEQLQFGSSDPDAFPIGAGYPYLVGTDLIHLTGPTYLHKAAMLGKVLYYTGIRGLDWKALQATRLIAVAGSPTITIEIFNPARFFRLCDLSRPGLEFVTSFIGQDLSTFVFAATRGLRYIDTSGGGLAISSVAVGPDSGAFSSIQVTMDGDLSAADVAQNALGYADFGDAPYLLGAADIAGGNVRSLAYQPTYYDPAVDLADWLASFRLPLSG